LCEAAAPDIFEIGPDGALHILMAEVPEDRRIDLEQACENCPTQALSIED
jgi:ferredoxin